MAFKIFLDANIVLDYLLQRNDLKNSESLFEKIIAGKVKAFITPSILHIVAHYIVKKYGIDGSKYVLLTLLNSVNVIESSHLIAITALQSNMSDIEDSLQYYTALYHKLDYFISLDNRLLKSGIPQLPIIKPIEFLNI